MCVCVTKQNTGKLFKKLFKNLKSPYISILLANALRTIAILLYPDYHITRKYF